MDLMEKVLLEDMHTSEVVVRRVLGNVEARFQDDECKPMKPAWDFWKHAYEAAAAAHTESEIVDAAKDAMGTDHEHIQPTWIVVQSLMKATVSMYWRRLMELYRGWDFATMSYKTPAVAPYRAEAQYLFRQKLSHIRPDICH